LSKGSSKNVSPRLILDQFSSIQNHFEESKNNLESSSSFLNESFNQSIQEAECRQMLFKSNSEIMLRGNQGMYDEEEEEPYLQDFQLQNKLIPIGFIDKQKENLNMNQPTQMFNRDAPKNQHQRHAYQYVFNSSNQPLPE
jgi:hypothetical protein